MASQAKLPKTDISDDVTDEAITKIDEIQNEIEKLNEKASEEIIQIETKYNKMRKPLYQKRARAIAQIPNFWVTALLNHPQLSVLITEEDEDPLQFLTQIDVEDCEDLKTGYKINFHFDENEWFTDKVITKQFSLSDGGESCYKCSEIHWKEGKNLVEKQKRTRVAVSANGETNRKRSNGSGEDPESLFAWLMSEGTAGSEMGEIIKDDLYPAPLPYFLSNEMDEEEEGEEGEFDGEDLDEDAEEDEEGE